MLRPHACKSKHETDVCLQGGGFTQYAFGVRETEGTLRLFYTSVLFHLYEIVSLGVIQHILVNSFYTQAWWENICEFYVP